MGDTTYTLGNHTARYDGKSVMIWEKGNTDCIVLIYDIQPHELMKIAKAIEDHNRLREFGEDSNHIA